VGRDRSFGYPEPPGDLAVGVTVSDQAEHVHVPAGEPWHAVAAPFGCQVGLVQVPADRTPSGRPESL
jgi:hypothetical protein